MKDALKGIESVLEHVAQWSGFRGSLIFIVDVEVGKNRKFKTITPPDLGLMLPN